MELEQQHPTHTEGRVEESQTLVGQCCSELENFVDQRPMTSLLTMFGAGLGLGVMLSVGLSSRIQRERELDENALKQFGRHALESMSHMVPESVRERMHR